MRRVSDFSYLKFVPPLLAKARLLVAQRERPKKLGWPKLGGEAARRASAAQQLLHSWVGGMSSAAAASHSLPAMLMVRGPGHCMGGRVQVALAGQDRGYQPGAALHVFDAIGIYHSM